MLHLDWGQWKMEILTRFNFYFFTTLQDKGFIVGQNQLIGGELSSVFTTSFLCPKSFIKN